MTEKLVRDKIPRIIAASKGVSIKDVPVRTLRHDAALYAALADKLVEEALEVRRAVHSSSLEAELADVMEVIDAFFDLDVNVRRDTLKRKRAKARSHGRFTKRIMLKIDDNGPRSADTFLDQEFPGRPPQFWRQIAAMHHAYASGYSDGERAISSSTAPEGA